MVLDLSLSNKIFETDILSAAMQEIEILFETINCELIGHPDFGTTFDQYLWALTPLTSSLKEYISSKINQTVFASSLRNHIDVEFINDSVDSMYHVKIYLYTDTEYTVKEFDIKNNE